MKCRGWGCTAALALLLGNLPAGAGPLRVTLGLEYDDNPFERAQGRRAGWVSRLYLYQAGQVLEGRWGQVQFQHQWGFKRFWRAETAEVSAGEVVANAMELGGSARLPLPLELTWGSELKVKNAQGLSHEESYLRGACRVGLRGEWKRALSGLFLYRWGRDDARSVHLVDVEVREFAAEVRGQGSRGIQGYLGRRWRWLKYARPILEWDAKEGRVREGKKDQRDEGQEWIAGVQGYRRVLVHASYSFLANRSNSVGYDFEAHRLQTLVSRPLFWRMDGQLYFAVQWRQYEESLDESPPGAGGEEEDERLFFSAKITRPFGERCGLSGEYRYSRSGLQGEEGGFRKRVYSLALDLAI